MEIALLNPQTARIRGKQVTIIVDPVMMKGKTPSDAILFFSRMPNNFSTENFEGNKIAIDGAGEYEIGGVNVSGYKQEDVFYYEIFLDGVTICIANASTIAQTKELKENEIALIRADVLVDQAVIAALNPNVLLFYGEKAEETVKALGKEEISPISKFLVTKEKLPQDTQILLLR